MEATELKVEDRSSSYKLVPWISWDDWEFVRNSLFSSSSSSVAVALSRISAWRSRGCVPVSVDITASIIEIQQKDSFFRHDELSEESLLSDELLAMLYCMSITRLVNGIIEKTRKKNEISIGAAADAIGLPRMLVDVRHDGSHRDLPSLQLVRLASITALEFLKNHYWEPQQRAILSEKTPDVADEVKTTLRNLVQASNPVGSRKQIKKLLRKIIRLYYSFSSEVVSVLLELLVKEFSFVDSTQNSEVKDIWRRIIIKLSNKEQQLLFGLVNAVLDTIETQKTATSVSGAEQKTSGLANLLEWLVGNIAKLKEGLRISETQDSSANLTKVLHKCLLLSSFDNNSLTSTAIVLAGITRNTLLIEKLNKLATLHSSNIHTIIDINEEESVRLAAEKLEIFKRRKRTANPIQRRWSVANVYNTCPIGMLSGLLPVLERKNEGTVKKDKTVILSKREAEICVEDLDDSVRLKKVKENEMNDVVMESVEGVEGKLMIGGILREVSEAEVSAIASNIRVLF